MNKNRPAEKAVPDALDQVNKNRLEEKGEFESKQRIYVRCQGKLRQMIGRDVKHVAIEDETVYVVHGGRIMSPQTTDQLRNNLVVHVVDEMPGGRKKKTSKKTKKSDQSTTDKSSSEVVVTFEMIQICSQEKDSGVRK